MLDLILHDEGVPFQVCIDVDFPGREGGAGPLLHVPQTLSLGDQERRSCRRRLPLSVGEREAVGTEVATERPRRARRQMIAISKHKTGSVPFNGSQRCHLGHPPHEQDDDGQQHDEGREQERHGPRLRQGQAVPIHSNGVHVHQSCVKGEVMIRRHGNRLPRCSSAGIMCCEVPAV